MRTCARAHSSARGAAIAFDDADGAIVFRTFNEVCAYRGWTLHAAHVRREHVHIVVSGLASPEAMMRDFKSYSSRRLHEQGRFVGQAVWARRGDVRRIETEEELSAAREYVVEKQGTMMAVHGLAPGDVDKSSPPPRGGGQ